MKRLPVIIILLTILAWPELLRAAPSAQQSAQAVEAAKLRHAAFAILDRAPTVIEAQAVFNGEQTLAGQIEIWLADPSHRDRVHRLFWDLFGTQQFGLQTKAEAILEVGSGGAYYLPSRADCGADFQLVDAWWADEPVPMCANSLGEQIEFGADATYLNCIEWNAMADERCGCGPDQLLCFPNDQHMRALHDELKNESARRGVWAWENDLSWATLFAGDFYGSRLLYYFYIYSGYIEPYRELPPAADLTRLASLPVWTPGTTAYPSGPERAPIVTAPNFLVQFNNPRSRIRALSERLLCQDISAALNTDGIATFVNSDLTEFDVQHGAKEGCSGCHFALDNMSSTILGWSDLAWWLEPDGISQLGHVFGQQGEGPQFLMTAIVERGPGFNECMVRQFWESMAGSSWFELDQAVRDRLLAAGEFGPRGLIEAIARAPELTGLR